MNLNQAIMMYLSHDQAFHTWVTVASALLALLVIFVYFMYRREVRGLKSKLNFAERAHGMSNRLVESYGREIEQWREIFGPFYSLYKNSPEATGKDHNSNTVAIDLDGVILEYVAPWDGPTHFGEAIPGAAQAISEIKELGYTVVIYTTRINPMAAHNGGYSTLELLSLVQGQLEKHGIPYDFIALFKPLAKYYIDDRAVRFKDWPSTLASVSYYEQRDLLDRADKVETILGGPTVVR